jgi:Spy/CpxP family protein refolding chaperone
MIQNSWVRRGAALVAAGGLCLSLAVGISRAAPEQGAQRPAKAAGKHRGARMTAMLERLNLSAEQKARIQTIRTRHREEMRSLRQQSSGDREALRGRIRELKTKHRAEYMAVLTPQQQQQLREEIQKARAARKNAPARS